MYFADKILLVQDENNLSAKYINNTIKPIKILKENSVKKLLASTAMLATLALAGCTSTGAGTTTGTTASTAMTTASSLGMSVLTSAVDTKCRTAIEEQSAWGIASLAMTDTQQETFKTNVCGCVTEQASEDVTIVELGNAAIDSSYRTELVANVVADSIQSCYTSFVQ